MIMEKLSLDGTVTLITGGGTGLGREMVRALARAGSDIILGARRELPIRETAEEVRKLGRKSMYYVVDITDPRQVQNMADMAQKEFGRVDVLINNAALLGAPLTPIWDMTDQEWEYGISANLTGAFYCVRALAKQMVDRGWGRIINVASQYGFRGGRNMFTYTCGKGGMVQLTRTLALSLGSMGVTCNTVAPAFIPTRTDDSKRSAPSPNPEFTPMGRFPSPSDLGPLVVFLASRASGYLNGGNINVDGASMAGGFAPNGYAPTYYEEIA